MTQEQRQGSGAQLPVKDAAMANFTNAVMREMQNIGVMEMTNEQRRLFQHLFIACDMSLRDAELKRPDAEQRRKAHADKKGWTFKPRPPIVWANVDMQTLAKKALNRVDLGLDALIPNHVSPIALWNSTLGKYTLDLWVGYVGKDYVHRKYALDPPLDVKYVLVHAGDDFVPLFGALRGGDHYKLVVRNPWKRGEVVGGYGYIQHEDERKNKLILVTGDDFEKSKKIADDRAGGTNNFWRDNPVPMRYKTLVNRTTPRVSLDPAKMSTSYAALLAEEAEAGEVVVDAEVVDQANKAEMDFPDETAEEREQQPDEQVDDAGASLEDESQEPPPPGEEAEVVELTLPEIRTQSGTYKSGPNKGKSWTRWYFSAGGQWYNTFIAELGKGLADNQGETVRLRVRQTDRGYAVLGFAAETATEPEWARRE